MLKVYKTDLVHLFVFSFVYCNPCSLTELLENVQKVKLRNCMLDELFFLFAVFYS